jgi:NDP-sugar pyrophosphorylase family protein
MPTDLYIIAAGKGSRLGGNIPKALVPIGGVPNLTRTLLAAKGKFQNTFIVANELIQDQWETWNAEMQMKYSDTLDYKSHHLVMIQSGLGDGHAALQGLQASSSFTSVSEDTVICWGDAVFTSDIFNELLAKKYRGETSGFLPAQKEATPYVTLLVDDRMRCISADFSKYGENHPSGFHDQSIFRFKRKLIEEALSFLHFSFWKNGRYITPGGELSLLYAFHFLYNVGNPAQVYETEHPTQSFNTATELDMIRNQLEKHYVK